MNPTNLTLNLNLHSQMHSHFMIKLSSSLTPTFRSTTKTALRLFSASSSTTTASSAAVLTIPAKPIIATEPVEPPPKTKASTRVKTTKAVSEALLKENWLDSLSCPMLSTSGFDPDSEWVLGVDPDVSGALAVLRPDRSVEVFDSPHVKVRVGKGVRKRLDAKSIVQLVKSFNAPIGTSVYVEQSMPFPQDGKQGWWSGGFGYGMWIGILVASGYSVVPVPSLAWKNEFKLSGNRSSKDASRELASKLFPSTSSLLKRKKDHGRAEALLIAAYGKGLKLMARSSCMCLENGSFVKHIPDSESEESSLNWQTGVTCATILPTANMSQMNCMMC